MATATLKKGYNNIPYTAVYQNENTFHQPRQKIWGVMVANEKKSGGETKWGLVYCNNDFDGAKEFFNSFLQNPQVDDVKLGGMENIIFIEILPANSNARV